MKLVVGVADACRIFFYRGISFHLVHDSQWVRIGQDCKEITSPIEEGVELYVRRD